MMRNYFLIPLHLYSPQNIKHPEAIYISNHQEIAKNINRDYAPDSNN
jgi:hypothetical protein